MRNVKRLWITYRYHVGSFSSEDCIAVYVEEGMAKGLLEKKASIAKEIVYLMIDRLVQLQTGSIITIAEIVDITNGGNANE